MNVRNDYETTPDLLVIPCRQFFWLLPLLDRDDRVEAGLGAHHARHVALAGQILRERHVARSDPGHRAVPDLDLGGAGERDRVLAPRRAVPVEDVAGGSHAERDAGGALHRAPFPVGALGVDEGLHGQDDLRDVGLAVGTTVDAPDPGHARVSLEKVRVAIRTAPGGAPRAATPGSRASRDARPRGRRPDGGPRPSPGPPRGPPSPARLRRAAPAGPRSSRSGRSRASRTTRAPGARGTRDRA